MEDKVNVLDQLYSDALTYIASGIPREVTYATLRSTATGMVSAHESRISDDAIRTEMGQALTDALKQGVEREDIDLSWF